MAEIDREVRRRRAAGEIPRDLEQELDLLFARFAPVGVGGDFDAVLERADRHAFLNDDVPVASSVPGGTFLKRVLHKLLGFYVRYVANQVVGFATSIVHAVSLLGDRVKELESVSPSADNRLANAIASAPRPSDPVEWVDLAKKAVAISPGRVLVADAGDGSLLLALKSAGTDAYGVDPDEERVDAAIDAGLEVRPDSVLSHLRNVPPEALGAVVLRANTEVLSTSARAELADLISTRLLPGGVVVVLSATPAAWQSDEYAILADLASDRPLRSATWQHLLAASGVEDFVLTEHARWYCLLGKIAGG